MSRNRTRRALGSREEPTNLEKFLPNGLLDRRSRIIRAVCRLIEERGAMSTSVSDIAREAKMSVPHLLYYFRSKEALLDEVFNSFSTSLLSRITSDRSANLSAEEQCQLLADNMFLESAQPGLDEAIIFEMIAYAVHSRGFRRTQQKHTTKVTNYLRRFFEQTPRTGFSAEESAVLVSQEKPTSLPSSEVPVALITSTPAPPFPAIVFHSDVNAPPITVLDEPRSTRTPSPEFPRAQLNCSIPAPVTRFMN